MAATTGRVHACLAEVGRWGDRKGGGRWIEHDGRGRRGRVEEGGWVEKDKWEEESGEGEVGGEGKRGRWRDWRLGG